MQKEIGLLPSRRRHIGVFVEWMSDGYSNPIVDEIVLAAAEHDVDLTCFVGGVEARDFPVPQRNMPAVYASSANIDGAVVVSMGNSFSSAQLEQYFARLEPMPLCSVAVQWTRYPSVNVDNETGVKAGVRHLIRSHRRRLIACIRGPEHSTEARVRFSAYRAVLDEFEIPFDPQLVTTGWYIQRHGVDAVKLMLDARGARFDAIVAANDSMALGALEELNRRGIRVPDEVSLLGFDDIDVGRHSRPPLSTVRQPVRAHGRKAFEMVMRQLDGQLIPRCTLIEAQLVLRKSCGCVASRWGMGSSAPPPGSTSIQANELERWITTCCQELQALFTNSRDPLTAPKSLRRGLVEDMLTAARQGDSRSFLYQLENQLLERGLGADPMQLLPMLDRKRHEVRGLVGAATEQIHLDAVLRDAGVLVAELAERTQAQQRYAAELQINRLLRMNEAFFQTRDFASLADVLAESLPEFGIQACYICLWEGDEVPALWATLVVACAGGKAIPLPPGGERFAASEVVPSVARVSAKPSAWLVCPLWRRESHVTAYAVILRGTAEAFVYDGLIDQIGSCLKRFELMRQLVEEVRLREAAERHRMEKELQIATEIQTGILPHGIVVRGLEISGCMQPATEVGGDYYDVISVEGGCWIGIGDVAGHGLPTGLVMLMCQSVIGGLVRNQPNAPPERLLTAANRLLYDNIRERMHQEEHITLALLRYEADGTLRFAGAHEALLIWRAKSRRVERVEMHGIWTGIVEDIGEMTPGESARLEPGDLLVLYTDGITEARNAEGQMFGDAGLQLAIEELHEGPVSLVRERILGRAVAWMHRQDDDMTLIVARYRAE